MDADTQQEEKVTDHAGLIFSRHLSMNLTGCLEGLAKWIQLGKPDNWLLMAPKDVMQFIGGELEQAESELAKAKAFYAELVAKL